MPRRARSAVGGLVYHVLNRANARATLFEEHGDYLAFQSVLAEAHQRVPMRTLAYTIMPNHWHLVLWPRGDGDLSEFMRWLTVTHVQRWHAHHQTSGMGHLYQGRFKSFPVQSDEHFLTLCRYVERNALRANLVQRAEHWRWCSLWLRRHGDAEARAWLSAWPVPCPKHWLRLVNQSEPQNSLTELRGCIARGRPYGSSSWLRRMVSRLGLESTLRPRGRPRKSRARDD